MRLNTAILLSQLIDEQEKRENELVKRLVIFYFVYEH